MLRSILIGLDGSPYSQSAIELGIDWARRFKILLVGLGIVDEPAICRPELVPLGADSFKQHSDEVRLARASHQVEQFLEQFRQQCTKAGVTSKVLKEVGDPTEQILREAQRYDLILLGQQTHFHFATQQEPCETLKKVLKNTPRPVVTVPIQRTGGTAVVIAFDGSLQAARALQAFQWLRLDGAKIHVVSVGADSTEVTRCADRAVEFLGLHELQATVHAVVSSAAPAQVLLDHLRGLNANLAVMGAYGKPGIREFFLGSVTRTLLQESPVPLFLYH